MIQTVGYVGLFVMVFGESGFFMFFLPGDSLLFTAGILLNFIGLLQIASVLLVVTALLYNWNVIKLLMHKPDPLCM